MPQIKKDYKKLNIKLDRTISDDLEVFATDNGISKTAVVEQALKVYFNQNSKPEKV